jgi:uncharacterized protein
MIFEWDEKKSLKNAHERGLPFEVAKIMDFDTALFEEDKHQDYGERRYVVYGLIGSRPHVLCFTPHHKGIRIIGLRKANQREVKYYEQENKTPDE